MAERHASTDRSLMFGRALLPDGWAQGVRVAIRDGAIAAVERGATPLSEETVHAIGLPGMPNLHSHAFQRGMAGLTEARGAEDDSFWTWRTLMYRFVDRISPDQLRAIAALAFAEMLETGFTRVGEFHYLHQDADGRGSGAPAERAHAIVEAAEESGIGLTLLPVFYAQGGFGGAPAGAGQRRFLSDRDGYARLLEASRRAVARLPDAVIGTAPHSLRAVGRDDLALIAALAEGGPIHIHVAEQVKEVEDCLAWSGARPVELLLDSVDVGARWCLVHATHLTAGELARLAASGAVAGLCPITEANLGDGIFPAADFLAAGGRFGIGSDSNVRIDMTEELRLLEYGQRLTARARNRLAGGAGRSTGETLYRQAVAGGGQALGVEAGIVAGAPADLLALDDAHVALTARAGGALVDSLIFAAGRGAIDRVWRRGELVVSGGRHRARDTIDAAYRKAMAELLDDAAAA